VKAIGEPIRSDFKDYPDYAHSRAGNGQEHQNPSPWMTRSKDGNPGKQQDRRSH
jgi:hypothetical protein